MPKRIQPLSDIQVKNAKPAPKEVKLFDGGGLFLLITPTGGKLSPNSFSRYADLQLTKPPEVSRWRTTLPTGQPE